MHKPCQPGIGAGDPCTAAWPKPAPGLGSGLPGRRTAAWPQVREPGTRDQGQLRLVNLGLGLGQLREHLVNLGEHLVNLASGPGTAGHCTWLIGRGPGPGLPDSCDSWPGPVGPGVKKPARGRLGRTAGQVNPVGRAPPGPGQLRARARLSR